MIASRRWQAWRQGWQDYCILTLVKEKLQKANDTAKLAELNQKVKDTINNGIDPVKTDAVRLWLKGELSTAP